MIDTGTGRYEAAKLPRVGLGRGSTLRPRRGCADRAPQAPPRSAADACRADRRAQHRQNLRGAAVRSLTCPRVTWPLQNGKRDRARRLTSDGRTIHAAGRRAARGLASCDPHHRARCRAFAIIAGAALWFRRWPRGASIVRKDLSLLQRGHRSPSIAEQETVSLLRPDAYFHKAERSQFAQCRADH